MSESSATEQLICCPKCLTVQRQPIRYECRWCRYDLQWLLDLPKVKEALTLLASYDAELSLETKWPGGEAHAQHRGQGPFPIAAGEHQLLVHWEQAPWRVQVEFGDQKWPLELPGRINPKQGKQLITARAIVARPADRFAVPILRNGPYKPQPIGGGICRIGRDGKADLTICEPQVAMQHCLIVRHPKELEVFWLFDLLNELGTVVNGEKVLARQLEHGDFIQLGGSGWRLSASDGFLVPEQPITGGELVWEEVTVGSRGKQLGSAESDTPRLPQFSEKLLPRELAAIVGPSGSGKSTLIKTVVGASTVDHGQVYFDQQNITKDRESFRQRLGYVSQQQVLHRQLTPKQVIALAYRFRKGQVPAAGSVERVLRSVDLPTSRWHARVAKLSGGEQKRVQVAAQLIIEPELFLLDEPTSGLDPQRAKNLVRLLRTFCHRGATVAMVTHDENHAWFDRTMVLQNGGKLAPTHPDNPDASEADDAGAELQVSGDLEEEADSQRVKGRAVKAGSVKSNHLRRLEKGPSWWQLFQVCCSREWHLIQGDWLWRCVLPLFLVPGLFAVSLHLAVSANDLSLLGFLAVISTIWMSASLGLLAIVDERRIVEYERLLYLKIAPYLAAKTLVLWVCSSFQTGIFFGLLAVLRSSPDRFNDMLYGPIACLGCLIILGWASVGLGLLLSAISGLSRHRANFLLPLVMIGQIVFSVQVAGNDDQYVKQAYEDFSPLSKTADSQSKCNHAAWLSYATHSRYGDIALRSFAYVSDLQSQGWKWRWPALGVLLTTALFLPGLAGWALWLRQFES